MAKEVLATPGTSKPDGVELSWRELLMVPGARESGLAPQSVGGFIFFNISPNRSS